MAAPARSATRFGVTGARLIVTHGLEVWNLKRGVAALGIGGGEATAIAVERGAR